MMFRSLKYIALILSLIFANLPGQTINRYGTTAANLGIGMVEGGGNNEGANVVSVADVVTFVHDKATAGDFAECISDGTNWFFLIKYDVASAMTLA